MQISCVIKPVKVAEGLPCAIKPVKVTEGLPSGKEIITNMKLTLANVNDK